MVFRNAIAVLVGSSFASACLLSPVSASGEFDGGGPLGGGPVGGCPVGGCPGGGPGGSPGGGPGGGPGGSWELTASVEAVATNACLRRWLSHRLV
jgi:hypothetical protein